MRGVLLATLRTHAGRLLASVLAVVIAVAFVVATLVLNQTAQSTVLRSADASYVGADLVATSTDGRSLAGAADRVREVAGVRAVDTTWETSVQAVLPGRTGAQFVLLDSVADDAALQWQQLSEGSLPTGPGEVALAVPSGEEDLEVGDVLPVTSVDAGGAETTTEVRLTGIVDLSGDVSGGLYAQGFVTADQARSWGALDPVELRVAGQADPAEVRAAIDPQDAGAVSLRTGDEAAAEVAAQFTGSTTALTLVLLVFATVAVLVAGLVIANTFAVLLAQRTRELALLRCVGATARQVRRSVLGEAVLTGLAASVLGVLAGVGLAAGVVALAGVVDSPIPLAGTSVPWSAVVVGLLLGTVVTVVAASAPARAATRVAPLAALRPGDAAPLRSRTGMARLVLGLLLLVPGTLLLVVGSLRGQLLVSLPGGALSFLGVVLLAQRAVPPVVAAAGRVLGRVGGVPGRLAAGNATRNPRRTAATATALLIGVTLTTAMVVGASSTRSTAEAGLAAAYPTDVVVGTDGDPVPDALLAGLVAEDGVARGVGVRSGSVQGPDGQPTQVEGFDVAATAPVLRSQVGTVLPEPGQVVLPRYLAEQWAVGAGDPVSLAAEGRTLDLTVVLGGSDVELPRLVRADLASLVPAAEVTSLWLRLDDGAGTSEVVGEVADLTGAVLPSARVTGLAAERASLDGVIDALLLVVTGLLGVAVVIALIGVGNTLALSVVERRQESGLLRALGLTRGQLRGLLAWESALVAGVAAVLGVLLGAAYGVAGAASVLGPLSAEGTVVSVPWLQVAAIVVAATGAGLLASVLPARRAARTSPVAAIAG